MLIVIMVCSGTSLLLGVWLGYTFGKENYLTQEEERMVLEAVSKWLTQGEKADKILLNNH